MFVLQGKKKNASDFRSSKFFFLTKSKKFEFFLAVSRHLSGCRVTLMWVDLPVPDRSCQGGIDCLGVGGLQQNLNSNSIFESTVRRGRGR
jgi:hypothetical protein